MSPPTAVFLGGNLRQPENMGQAGRGRRVLFGQTVLQTCVCACVFVGEISVFFFGTGAHSRSGRLCFKRRVHTGGHFQPGCVRMHQSHYRCDCVNADGHATHFPKRRL